MIAILFLLNSAWAELPKGCHSANNLLIYSDLRKDFGDIKDQGQVGWCYAYPTADLLNHKLARFNHTHNLPKAPDVSPRAVALNNISVNAARRGTKIGDAFLANESFNEISRRLSENMSRSEGLLRPLELLKDSPPLDVLQKKIALMKAKPGNEAGIAYLERKVKAVREYGSFEGVSSELARLEKERIEDFRKQSKLGTIIGIENNSISGGAQVDSLESALNGRKCDGSAKSTAVCSKGDMCTEDDVPSGEIAYRKKWKRAGQYYKDLGVLSDGSVLQQLFQFQRHADDSKQVCRSAMMAHLLSPNESIASFQDIFTKQAGNDPIKYILGKCKDRGVAFSYDFKESFKIKSEEVNFKAPNQKAEVDKVMYAMDLQLQNKEPVAIAINPEILLHADKNYQHKIDEKGNPQAHSVTVVGNWTNCGTGEEEYAIRNSWGKGSCERHISEMGSKAPYRCENGYFIVPASHLRKGIIGATSLQDVPAGKR